MPPAVIALNPPAQDLIFNPNSNQLQSQFQVEFNRAVFSSLLSTPTPPATPTPIAPVWKANCFVTQPGTINGSLSNYVPIDSLGAGAGTDTTYVAPNLDTTIAFDIRQAAAQTQMPSDPNAVITSCEFANAP